MPSDRTTTSADTTAAGSSSASPGPWLPYSTYSDLPSNRAAGIRSLQNMVIDLIVGLGLLILTAIVGFTVVCRRRRLQNKRVIQQAEHEGVLDPPELVGIDK
ncbi:hypothetical protein PSPO01_05308 [Paraphaeosphaeria sporulosa]